MSDQWLRDYEKAWANAQKLAKEVEGAGTAREARKAAMLRGHLAQLKQEVTHLEQSLMAASQNTTAYAITRKELSRRGDLMSQLSEALENLQEAVRTGARRAIDAASASSSQSPWGDRGSKKGAKDTQGMSSSDLMQATDDEIRDQDETLDFLHGTIANLKNIGGEISNEIDLHCRLLGDLEESADSSTAKVQNQKARLQAISEQSSSSCTLWGCACCLFILLLLLLFYF